MVLSVGTDVVSMGMSGANCLDKFLALRTPSRKLFKFFYSIVFRFI